MKRKAILAPLVLLMLMVCACGSQQLAGEKSPYHAWSKQAIALHALEEQYGRLMQSETTLPPETKQNLRDEVWPVLDEAYKTLKTWKGVLDGGVTEGAAFYDDKINRLINEIEMPEEDNDG